MPRHRRDVLALLALTLLDRVAVLAQAPAAPAPTVQSYRLEPYSADHQRRLGEPELALLEKLNRRDRAHLVRLTEIVVSRGVDRRRAVVQPVAGRMGLGGHAREGTRGPPADAGVRHLRVRSSDALGTGQHGAPRRPRPAGCSISRGSPNRAAAADNAEWILNWYFNFINSRGVSFHEFELPGRPASHACVRLLQRDAQWVYGWGEQWRLSADQREVVTPGTPVAILGAYDFRRPAPWLTLEAWRARIALPADPAAGNPQPM